ncbi:hypothetical protein LPJ78_002500 [Coemansia sp. RSA 989]|nr:hypothetical protein LPJ78_002500 [Coemansia sp. RSA 989]
MLSLVRRTLQAPGPGPRRGMARLLAGHDSPAWSEAVEKTERKQKQEKLHYTRSHLYAQKWAESELQADDQANLKAIEKAALDQALVAVDASQAREALKAPREDRTREQQRLVARVEQAARKHRESLQIAYYTEREGVVERLKPQGLKQFGAANSAEWKARWRAYRRDAQPRLEQLEQRLQQTGSIPGAPEPARELTLERMMAAGMHLGHSKGLWNPMNLPFIFGERQGIHIINLEHTMAALRRAAQFVKQTAYHGGLVLFVGTRREHRQLAIDAALESSQYFVSGRWTPGTITNQKSLFRRHFIYAKDAWDVADAQELLAAEERSAQETLQASAETNRYLRMLESEKKQLRERAESRPQAYKPDLIISLSPRESRAMLYEARKSFVPTVGIIDTNSDPTSVTYPIPCNDDSPKAVAIVAGILAKAAKSGMELRKHRLMAAAQKYNQKAVRSPVPRKGGLARGALGLALALAGALAWELDALELELALELALELELGVQEPGQEDARADKKDVLAQEPGARVLGQGGAQEDALGRELAGSLAWEPDAQVLELVDARADKKGVLAQEPGAQELVLADALAWVQAPEDVREPELGLEGARVDKMGARGLADALAWELEPGARELEPDAQGLGLGLDAQGLGLGLGLSQGTRAPLPRLHIPRA